MIDNTTPIRSSLRARSVTRLGSGTHQQHVTDRRRVVPGRPGIDRRFKFPPLPPQRRRRFWNRRVSARDPGRAPDRRFTHVVRYGRTSALGSAETPSLLDGASHGPVGRSRLGAPQACALACLPFSRTPVMGLPARGGSGSGAAQTNRCLLISSSHEKQTAIKPRASRDREVFLY